MFDGFLSFFNQVFFFTSYVKEPKGSFPQPLSKAEEEEALRKAKEGDNDAKELLVRHNLRLVAHIVKKYNGAGEVDDLISIGTIGLIKAISSYQYGKGTVLATYVARCVENEILMHLRRSKKYKNDISIYEGIGRDKDGNELKIESLLFSASDTVYKEVIEEINREKLLSLLKQHLEDREYDIIIMRYGITGGKPLTQRETSQKLGISRSYISRIEKKAISKMKKVLKRDDFEL
ncbi:MAG: RNA polymerase sporulation sigma factor SigK [Bacillota bacterium]